jgi:hypothetical protein
MTTSPPRWILSKTTSNAHLDLGERSSESLRVYADHVIVTACRAHIAATAQVVPESHQPKCSNCLRILRDRATPKIVPDLLENWRASAPGVRGTLVIA